jgi:hypothetical protein
MAVRAAHFYNRCLVIVMLALLAAACSPQPAAPSLASPTVQSEAASSPIPPTPAPVLPTLAPTATPNPEPKDYLIAAAQDFLLASQNSDVQELFNYPVFVREYDLNGHRTTLLGWRIIGGYQLNEAITIAQQPWEKIPADGFTGLEYFAYENAAQDEPLLLDQNSQGFVYAGDPSQGNLVFIKGNALVSLYASGITSDDVVNLGKLLAAGLPDTLPVQPPISFPDQLDPEAFSKYFTEVTIGNFSNGDSIEPANSFPFENQLFGWDYVPASDTQYWNLEERGYDAPVWEIAVVDLQTGQYVYRNAAIWSAVGMKPVCFLCNLTPGQYEFKLAMQGVLVFSAPFEITE